MLFKEGVEAGKKESYSTSVKKKGEGVMHLHLFLYALCGALQHEI